MVDAQDRGTTNADANFKSSGLSHAEIALGLAISAIATGYTDSVEVVIGTDRILVSPEYALDLALQQEPGLIVNLFKSQGF